MTTQKTTKDNCNQRVIIIGLDGATFDVISPMIAAGQLPNISRLINNGSSGTLLSTIPPLSPVAWTSLSTGVNPSKHGILDFIRKIPDSYEVDFFSAASRKANPLWYWLSNIGKRVGIISVPMTYPPDKVNGFMISGLGSPEEQSGFMYPDSLLQELEKEIGGYRLENIDFRTMSHKPDKLITELYEIFESRFDTANYLIDRYPWDFFFLVFESTDRAQHSFWECMNGNANKTGKYADLINNVYEKADEKIGMILKKIGPEDTVLIVSDHGLTSIQKGVRLNFWLADQSYLTFYAERSICKRLKRVVLKTGKSVLRSVLPEQKAKKRKKHGPNSDSNSFNVLPNVDMNNTKAYCLGSYGIYLNVKGRDRLGTIEPGVEYESIREKIMSDLLKFEDPATGRKVIDKVFKREDVIVGEFENIAPDIYILWNKGYFFISERQKNRINAKTDDSEFFCNHYWSGQHAREGIIIANGPHIRKDYIIKDANISDVAPTVMYLMGLDVPKQMDGKVLTDMVDEDCLKSRPVSYSVYDEGNSPDNDFSDGYSKDEADTVMDRLRGLGYVD